MRPFVFTLLLMLFLAASLFGGDLTGRAVILGDAVNVRRSPSTGSPVVGRVFEGRFVEILSWEAAAVSIGSLRDRWARIRMPNGKTGYLFGAFLFELADLYAGNWVARMWSGIDGIKLNRYGTWQVDMFDERGSSRHSGRLTVSGRFMTLHASAKLVKRVLYFHRFKGRRCLTTQKISPSAPLSSYHFGYGDTKKDTPLEVYFQQPGR